MEKESVKWKKTALKEVAICRNGAGIKQEYFRPKGVPLVRVSDFTENSIDMQNCFFVDPIEAKKWEMHRLKSGDVIIATVGSWPPNWSSVVGKAIRVPKTAEGAIQNQNSCCVVAYNDRADQRFLFYLLRSEDFILFAANSAGGSANQARLPVGKLENFYFDLPPLPIQHAIARILGSLDDKIELNRRMNETLEAMARAIFQSWFVDFDPVRAKAERRDTGLPPEVAALFPSEIVEVDGREVPKGWKLGSFSDFCEIQGGFAYKSESFSDSGHKVVKIKNIGLNGIIDLSNVDYVSHDLAIETPDYWLNDGDILIAMTGATLGKFGIFINVDELKSVLNQRVGRLTGLKGQGGKNHFIYSCLCLEEIQNQIISVGDGSAQANISCIGILQTKTIVPTDTIIKEFNNLTDMVFQKIIANIKESRTLAQIGIRCFRN